MAEPTSRYRRLGVTMATLVGAAGVVALGAARTESAVPESGGLAAFAFVPHAEDDDLWVDADGMQLYADRDLGAPEHTGDASALANSHNPARPASYAYDQTFRLHSLPGATKVAYLDFDGHTVSNSAWNTSFTAGAPFDVGAYDIDGIPGSFSTAELDAVQEIWQRVSEDFAAMQIDVTTEAPSDDALDRSNLGDDRYGVRLVVSNTTMVYSSCGCGGVSYVGGFNYVNPGDPSRSHRYYQPSFVFQNGVGTSPKTVAEAASHEIGHSLGLSHDTTASSGGYTGQGPWAPIMGTGYSKPITQWSRGDYAGALNTEDDFAVMQSHGVPLVVDDVGDSLATAVPLGAEGGVRDGVISSSTDADVYSFTTAGGPATVTASPATVSPDLDVSLAVINAGGAALAAADPAATMVTDDFADGLGATVRLELAPGTYYVRVDGAGYGDASNGYSDYASVGRYRVSVVTGSASNSAPAAAAAASTTSGRGPLTVTFSSNGSGDGDGQVVGYWWDFGDGATSSEPDPTHVFEAAGSYPVTLTVTDDRGASASASLTVDVTDIGNRITSLELTLRARTKTRSYASAFVSAVSPTGAPLGRALVLGAWTGSDKRWVLGITDASGNVWFDSLNARKTSADFGFTILWAGYLEHPYDWSAAALTSANVWYGGPSYWASASPS